MFQSFQPSPSIDVMNQLTPTSITNDPSSTQIEIETHFINLNNNSKIITTTKGNFCNKKVIPQLVQKYIAANSRLEEAEEKLERLQK